MLFDSILAHANRKYILRIAIAIAENMAAMTKIFRSLFIIMLVVVLGWMLTMSGVLIASLVFHLEGNFYQMIKSKVKIQE